MTSKNSSLTSPKSASRFRTKHIDLLTHRLWVGALSLILQVLMYSVATPLRIVYERSQVASTLTTEAAILKFHTDQAQTIFGQMCLSWPSLVLTLVLAVVIAHQGFAYVFSRRELDFYMSQPVKRSQHFRNVYMNGVLLYSIPYLISVGLGMLVALGMNSMTVEVFFEILYGSVRLLLLFLCYYSLSIIAVLMTGREVYAIIMTVFIMVAELMGQLIFSLLRSFYLATYYASDSETILDIHQLYLTPLYNAYCGKSDILTYISENGMNATGRGVFLVDRWTFLYLLIFSIVAYFLALLCFKKRKSEACGTGICFKPVAVFTKIYCAVFGSLLVGTVLDQIFADVAWKTRTVIVILIVIAAAFLIASLVETILERDIKRFFTTWKVTLTSCAIALVILVGFRWDLTGYDSYLPAEEDVLDFSLTPTYMQNMRSVEGSGTQAEIETLAKSMHLTAVQPMLQVAELSQANLVLSEKRNVGGTSVEVTDYSSGGTNVLTESENGWMATVEWRLKDGRKIRRNMLIPYSIDGAQMDRIIANDSYRNNWYRLNSLATMANTNSMSVNYSTGFDSRSLNESSYLVQEFLQAYRADLTQYGFQFARDNEVVGTIEWWCNGTYYGDMSYEVYASYTNTIAFLRRNDLYLDNIPSQSAVYSADVVLYRYNTDYSDSYDSRFTTTDVEEIAELLSCIKNSNAGSDWEIYTESEPREDGYVYDYDVILTLQTQGATQLSSAWFDFKDGEIPEWVESRLAQ